jgi:hypothetical protein
MPSTAFQNWSAGRAAVLDVENRGNLGVGVKRLYRVRVRFDDITEPIETSLPADDLTLLAKAPSRARNGRHGSRE